MPVMTVALFGLVARCEGRGGGSRRTGATATSVRSGSARDR